LITDIIVLSSILFAAVFAAAWLARPDLRAWIERPKHEFQASVRRYDRTRTHDDDTEARRD